MYKFNLHIFFLGRNFWKIGDYKLILLLAKIILP